MRKYKLRLFTIVGMLSLFSLSSCWDLEDDTPKPERPGFTDKHPTKKQIIQIVQIASAKAAKLKMKQISPNTGKNPRYNYDTDEMVYDSQTQNATIPIKITWTAKKTELSNQRSTCEISGMLSISFVNRSANIVTATFIPETYNDWVKECLAYVGNVEATALEALTFDTYK